MNEQSRQKSQFWVILIIVFLGFVGISMPYLIFPALFLNPDYSILPASWGESSRAIYLGITLAAYPFGQFLGSPILGSLSDDYGRKRLLSGSLLIAAFCNLLSGIAIQWQYLGLLILSRFTAGLMEGNIAIVRAMAADITALSKHDTFGRINAASSIAFLVGPLLGGLMADKSLFAELTASTPFYFICILFFGLTGLSLLMIKDSKTPSSPEERSFWQRINLTHRLGVLFSNKRLKFLLIASTCFTLAVDIFYEFGPVYLTVKWDLNPAQLVFYNGALCLALAIGNGWLPAIVSSRISKRMAVIYSILGFAFFLMGTVLTDSTVLMMLLFTLSGLVIGLAVTLITVKISDSVPDAIQGEVMGVQISLRVLGDAFICLFGGALLLLSAKLILIAAAILSLAAMAYYAIRGPAITLS
ncbi:MFS transporter [Candidatus Protochlamydia phocaeensis]|uniref:MFS transporter n=1 Tax=Candidatus Protochlamydia phocaeensis TaxID=1414722 RepID=UPI000837DC5A|nr:MFS transporter [Candidatus Protochlamydia phocaeensis]